MKNTVGFLQNLVYRDGYLKTKIMEGVVALKPYVKNLEVIHIKVDYPNPSTWRKNKYYHVIKQMICSRLDEWIFKHRLDQNEYVAYLQRYRPLKACGKIEDIDEYIMDTHYRPQAVKILRCKKFFDLTKWSKKRIRLEYHRRSNLHWKNGDEYRFDYRNCVESLFIRKNKGNKEVIGVGGSGSSGQRQIATFFTAVFYVLAKKTRIPQFLLKYNAFNAFEYVGRKYRAVLIPGFGANFDLDRRLMEEIREKGFYWE